MSIVRDHKRPVADAPRDRSDLRAASGLLQRDVTAHDQRSHRLRVARIGNTVVGVCHLSPETLRLGESRLRTARIERISVHPNFEPQLVRGVLLEDCVRHFNEAGYPLLFATEDEFTLRRFRFHPVPAPRMAVLDTVASDERDSTYRVRRAKPGDISVMRRLYSRHHENDDACFLRDRSYYAERWEQFEQALLAIDNSGAAIGYAVVLDSGGSLRVVEAYWRDESARALLAQAIREHCSRLDATQVVAPERLAGPDAIGFRSAETALHANPVHIEECLQAMLPEWESCLKPLQDSGRHTLTLDFYGECHRLQTGDSSLAIDGCAGENRLRLTSAEFVALLFGNQSPESVLGQRYRIQPPAVRDLIDTVFPERFVRLNGERYI